MNLVGVACRSSWPRLRVGLVSLTVLSGLAYASGFASGWCRKKVIEFRILYWKVKDSPLFYGVKGTRDRTAEEPARN